MSAPPTQTAVVVVGGSLVVLCAAIFLRAQNVPVVVIERHERSSPHPRAMGFTVRTLETFQGVGIEPCMPVETVTAGGKPRRLKVDSLSGNWHDEVPWTKPANRENNIQCHSQAKPTTAPPDSLFGKNAYSPCSGSSVAQDALEPVLRIRAVELGADLRLGWEMTRWDEDSSGVCVTAVNRSSNNEIILRGQYLLACDGSQSSIRSALGIGMNGVGHMGTMRSILFRCPAINRYLESGISQFAIQNDIMGGFLTTYRDGRWALMVSLNDSEVQSIWDEGAQRRMIRAAIGEKQPLTDADIQLITTGQWELSARVADRFSCGRVFLVGDAAHSLPPTRGGYGANTGIADAHNLAWKLAAVLAGSAKSSLLDTYDAERRPVARLRHEQIFLRDDYKDHLPVGSPWRRSPRPVFDDVAMELGQLYRSAAVLFDEAGRALAAEELEAGMIAKRPEQWRGSPGTRAPHLWLSGKDGDRISTLDLFGEGWVVLSEDENVADWICSEALTALDVPLGIRFVSIGPSGSYSPEDGKSAFLDAFGVGHSGLILVRPDGWIAWRAVEASTESSFIAAVSMVSHMA